MFTPKPPEHVGLGRRRRRRRRGDARPRRPRREADDEAERQEADRGREDLGQGRRRQGLRHLPQARRRLRKRGREPHSDAAEAGGRRRGQGDPLPDHPGQARPRVRHQHAAEGQRGARHDRARRRALLHEGHDRRPGAQPRDRRERLDDRHVEADRAGERQAHRLREPEVHGVPDDRRQEGLGLGRRRCA